jgi:formylglycine-generating enzyme required for sulfatase activity
MAVVLAMNGCSKEKEGTGEHDVYNRWPFTSAEAKRRQQESAKGLGLDVEKTLQLGNGQKLELVLIPAGEFVMGSPATEKDRLDDEGPQRRITISRPFYMSKTEITQGQYAAITGQSPWKGEAYAKDSASHAASYISWDDTQSFCRTASQKTRQTVQLPTEAQWEYACRAGSDKRFSYGDDPNYQQLDQYAWYRDNAYKIGEKYAHAVGKKKANAFGLHDMHGNVWEWCQDWYDDEYDPKDLKDPKGPGNGRLRVLRGGSWYYYARYCRSADRYRFIPDYRRLNHGFRVVVSCGGVD